MTPQEAARPRIESVFSAAEIEEMRARFMAEAEARAARVRTNASRALLAASRTVIDKDREIVTVVDGDVLGYIRPSRIRPQSGRCEPNTTPFARAPETAPTPTATTASGSPPSLRPSLQ